MKILCFLGNYPLPAAERESVAPGDAGTAGTPAAPPRFYLKPDTALLRNNDPFYLPDFTHEVHAACEVAVRINRLARCVEERFAHRLYAEVGLGISFTAADLLRSAAREGLPWTAAAGFDYSAAVAPQFIPLAELGGDIQRLHFALEVNGEVRQQGFTGDMIHSVGRLLNHLTHFVTLRMGDLIFTGTPAGAGAVAAGDTLRATLEGREMLNFDIR